MALRVKKSPTKRYINQVKREQNKKIFIVCEGDKTEVKYFQGLQDHSKELGINDLLELVVMDKDAASKGTSDPAGLVRLVNEKKEEFKCNNDGTYDEKIDKFLIVIDRDKDDFLNYHEFINKHKDEFILGITNPCFELWLLLHKEGSLENIIKPNYDKVLENSKNTNSHTFTSNLVSQEFHMNPKRGMRFSKFKNNLTYAINQEKELEQELFELENKVGSNIGKIIEREMLK